jgi:formylglycine-generating enzyme required for sulfatase activity
LVFFVVARHRRLRIRGRAPHREIDEDLMIGDQAPISRREFLLITGAVASSAVLGACVRLPGKDPLTPTPNPSVTPTPFIPDLALVEAGSFMMGSMEGRPDEQPAHEVHISRAFYMCKFELTQSQYLQFCSVVRGVRWPQDLGWGHGPSTPQVVTWYEAVKLCNWLSENEGLDLCYSGQGRNTACDFEANGYRMPTEAEWEFAARGGIRSQGFLYAGKDNPDYVAWYYGNSGAQIQNVGQKQPNELGMYDMSGNGWEWCWDWYGEDYYAESPPVDPRGPSSGTERIRRGGSFMNNAPDIRTTFRSADLADNRYQVAGLRVMRLAESSQ